LAAFGRWDLPRQLWPSGIEQNWAWPLLLGFICLQALVVVLLLGQLRGLAASPFFVLNREKRDCGWCSEPVHRKLLYPGMI